MAEPSDTPKGTSFSGAWVAFLFCLAIYLYTRLSGLDLFPVFFHCDEAYQLVWSRELWKDRLFGPYGEFLPLYYRKAPGRWVPQLSLYLYLLPIQFGPNSIFMARAPQAVFSLTAAASLAWAARQAFGSRIWWCVPLLLGCMPIWFIHSRTAWETNLGVTFFGCALAFYLLYLTRSPRYLHAAVICGIGAFYSHFTASIAIVVFAALALACDLPYHFRHRRHLLAALLLAAFCAWPFIRFAANRPGKMEQQLNVIHSHWTKPESGLSQKIGRAAGNFSRVLSPYYWFSPAARNKTHEDQWNFRHIWKDLPHLQKWMLPLLAGGLALSVARIRDPKHRALLLATVASLSSVLLVRVHAMRVLSFVMPASLLCVVAIDLLASRARGFIFPALLLAMMAGQNLGMLQAAKTKSDKWFPTRQLGAWGGREVFADLAPRLIREGATRVLVGSKLTVNCNMLRLFFLPPELKKTVRVTHVNGILDGSVTIDPGTVYVMTPAEVANLEGAGRFMPIVPIERVNSPDGRTHLLVFRLDPLPSVEA